MKIQKVIFTCDDNPAYSGFWKSISKHFLDKLGIRSHLFLIGDDENKIKEYKEQYNDVTFIKKLPNIPGIIQALWGKFYFTKTEPETVWMVGDLDLYPLQKDWFVANIEKYEENSYLHLNAFGYSKEWWNNKQGLPGYYHVAKGKTFEKYLKFRSTFEEDCKYIYESGKYGLKDEDAHSFAKAASKDWKYFCSEEQYSADLLKDKKNEIIGIDWGVHINLRRICRSTGMQYNPQLLNTGYYIDLHAPRPYVQYKDQIEDIITKIK